jgi:hypothetical protein
MHPAFIDVYGRAAQPGPADPEIICAHSFIVKACPPGCPVRDQTVPGVLLLSRWESTLGLDLPPDCNKWAPSISFFRLLVAVPGAKPQQRRRQRHRAFSRQLYCLGEAGNWQG